jgi:hypothetical protein
VRAGQELLEEEMLAKLDAHDWRIMAEMDSQQEKMEACVENGEATDFEEYPEELEAEAGHEVETSRTLKEWYGDRYLAVRRRGPPKKWNQFTERNWQLPDDG